MWTYCDICSLVSAFRICLSRPHLTHSPVINSRIWTWSNASLKYRSVYQAANTAASWLAAKTPPTSNARTFAEATPRAAAGHVNLDATSVRRLRVITQPLVRALFVPFGLITKVIPANERSSVNTFVASHVPRITRVIRSVLSRAGSDVAIRNAQRNAGSLARRVWSRVNGAVPTILARWSAVR